MDAEVLYFRGILLVDEEVDIVAPRVLKCH